MTLILTIVLLILFDVESPECFTNTQIQGAIAISFNNKLYTLSVRELCAHCYLYDLTA